MIIFRNKLYEKENFEKEINYVLTCLKSQKVTTVGVMYKRTPELLYLLKSLYDYGIAFVTIDPSFPISRIDYILKTANIEWVVTQEQFKASLGNRETLCMNELKGIKEEQNVGTQMESSENELAYILFTSGSTGKPKGVEITRDALNNFFFGIEQTIDFFKGNRIACLTTVAFDIFILESLYALKRGITVVLADEREQLNPRAIAMLLKKNAVDIVQMTPSGLQMLLNYDMELSCLEQVKILMVGGEVFPLKLLKQLQNRTVAKIYNMYGPTETTIWSCVSDLTSKERVDIGKPIINTDIYILDEHLHTVNYGMSGEICIAGKGLARGYIGERELTQKKFTYLPDSSVRIYRTGDIGCYLPDGSIKYIGRKDNQIKIHGYRIELEEIETCANEFEGIKRTVAYYDSSNDVNMLRLYYTSNGIMDPKELVLFLSKLLPQYMLPAEYCHVENFFYTFNGKIDRKRVKECAVSSVYAMAEQKVEEKSVSMIQIKVRNLVAEFLKEKISADITFETRLELLGIDSLTFIKLIVFLEEKFDFMFDDDKLLFAAFPTIYALGDYIQQKLKD